MSLLRLFSVAVLLIAALPAAAAEAPPTAPPSPADAAVRDQVRGLVRQAGESMDRGDRPHAAVLLEQARRLRPDPSLDYNLGITYAEMNQGPEAAHAFGRFLGAADPGRVLPERIADARKRLAEYERSLARLRMRISGAGSGGALYLDDRPSSIALVSGSLPAELNPLWLLPGLHRVRVTSPGLKDYQVVVEIAAGESREVTGDLDRDDATAGLLHDPPPPPSSKEPPPLYKKWWFWTAIGAGAVTAFGLIGAGAAGRFSHTAPGSDLDAVNLALSRSFLVGASR